MPFATLALAACLCAARADSLSAADWRTDLRHLVTELERWHPNPYHRIRKPVFDSAVAALDARIPTLTGEQVIVELATLVSSLGDGHTFFAPAYRSSGVNFGGYPVVYHLFSDGLYVQATDSANASLLEGRVTRIGRLTADEALAAVAPLVSNENSVWVRRWSPTLLARPEILRALGIADADGRVAVTIERGGRETTVELGFSALPRPSGAGGLITGEGWRTVRPNRAPLWLRHPEAPFWFDYLADSRTLYVQYNQIADGEKESAAAFFERVAAFAAARPVERFVLDLRLNGGGDNTFNPAVVRTILRSPKLSQPERFFTLIGPQTFSAAQNLVNELERYTGTIFVGEPTGSRPNMYGDAVPITLPRSGFTVYVSTLWWQDVDPRDRRQWTAPAVAAESSAKDFRRGRDPALAAALAYRPGSSLTASMRAALSQGDTVGAIDRYRAYRADPAHRYVDTEAEIEALAISLAREGKVAPAVALVELNAREHPRSAQAQYILGEAYRRGGDRGRAAAAFKRALTLDPRHAGAHQGLRELGGS